MLENEIKEQVLRIIAETSIHNGWAKQATVCLQCQKQGVNLKEYGGAKIVFSQLSDYVEISSDSDRLPILKLKGNSFVKDGSITTSIQSEAEEKKGLCRLGYVRNLPKKINHSAV